MKFIRVALLNSSIILIGLINITSAQLPPIYIYNSGKGQEFGQAISSAGDVDNDNFDDIIVGAPYNDSPGKVFVYSGQSGNPIWIINGETFADEFGFAVTSASDLDSDGYSDFAVGAPNYNGLSLGWPEHSGRIYVFSGFTGDTLYTFTGQSENERCGHSISLNPHSVYSDFYHLLVGAPFSGIENSGAVHAIQADIGVWLGTIDGDDVGGSVVGERFGWAICPVIKSNQWGFNNHLYSAPFNDINGINAGAVYMQFEAIPPSWESVHGFGAGDQLGYSIASAGDVGHNDWGDYIAGAPYNDASGLDAGSAYIFEPIDYLVKALNGESAGDHFGISVALAGDVNGDGFDDVIVGAPGNDAGGSMAGRAYVFSGKTSEMDLIRTFTGVAGENLGTKVAGAGDVNNDGYDDLIVSAVNLPQFGGRVYVYRGSCCVGNQGDFNGDGDDANTLDLTYGVNRIFRNGPPPPCTDEADLDFDEAFNILDLSLLINVIFRGDPPPGPC